MIRLMLSVPGWWLLSRAIDRHTNLGRGPADLIAALLVVAAWPVVAGVGQMFGLRRRPAVAAPPPPSGGEVGERRVGIGPTAFSSGFWGWLIARQLRGRR